MDASSRKSIHPLMATAAIAVILFSVVGIGAITGVIPTSRSNSEAVAEQSQSAQPAPVAQQQAQPARPAAAPDPAPKAQPQAPARPARDRQTAARSAPAQESAPEARAIQEPRVAAASRSVPAPAPVCYDCGTIESIREVKQSGEGSGVGAVAGGVAGAVLGRQIGGGRGRDLATVAGAVGGAVAGHQVEKHVKSSVVYEISVRMDDGSMRAFTESAPPSWRTGDKVRVQDDRLTTRG